MIPLGWTRKLMEELKANFPTGVEFQFQPAHKNEITCTILVKNGHKMVYTKTLFPEHN